jgi:hypothetical protein
MEFDRNYVWITTRRLKPGTREAPDGNEGCRDLDLGLAGVT